MSDSPRFLPCSHSFAGSFLSGSFAESSSPPPSAGCRLAQARAEEAIIRAHVDNALMFVDTLAEDLTLRSRDRDVHSRDGDSRAARQHGGDANTRRARPGSGSLPPPRCRRKRRARRRSSEASSQRRLTGTRTAANDQARVALGDSSAISSSENDAVSRLSPVEPREHEQQQHHRGRAEAPLAPRVDDEGFEIVEPRREQRSPAGDQYRGERRVRANRRTAVACSRSTARA